MGKGNGRVRVRVRERLSPCVVLPCFAKRCIGLSSPSVLRTARKPRAKDNRRWQANATVGEARQERARLSTRASVQRKGQGRVKVAVKVYRLPFSPREMVLFVSSVN